ARIDLAPGVDDADRRLAGPILAVIAELLQARAMAEGAQRLGAEPAVAAELLGGFFWLAHSRTLVRSARINWRPRRQCRPRESRRSPERSCHCHPTARFLADRRLKRRIAVGVEQAAAVDWPAEHRAE